MPGSNFACDAVVKVTRPTAALLSPLALSNSRQAQSVVRVAGRGSTHAHLHTSIRKAKLAILEIGSRLMHTLSAFTNSRRSRCRLWLSVARASHE
jgi:hypothetical protein